MATAGGNGGSANDLTGGSPYTAGTVVNIQATANNGSAFYNWTAPAGSFANANSATTTFTMPAQDVTVTANFVVPEFVYLSTYSGSADTYWKWVWLNRVYVTPNSGESRGGWCDYYETNFYSDAACTTTTEPIRKIVKYITITLTLHAPMKEWRNPDDLLLVQRYSEATANIGGLAKNWVYYRNLTGTQPGAPWTLSETFSETEEIDSDNDAGDSENTRSHVVAGATESVTVPAGTFTCYKNTITVGSKTIIEYWDASGVFPYMPIKTVDNVAFQSTDTKVLVSTTINLNP